MDDRLSALEKRLARLERALSALSLALYQGEHPPSISPNPDEPLQGHPLIGERPPQDVLERQEAQRRKELGIENIKLMSAPEFRQMLIDAGWDPNSNESSREIIAEREERG